jgi:hypothetical protein
MDRAITTVAFAALALGGRHLYRHLKNRKKNKLQQAKLETWEGEGGAVPVARDRTAAQIAPRRARSASPRADRS